MDLWRYKVSLTRSVFNQCSEDVYRPTICPPVPGRIASGKYGKCFSCRKIELASTMGIEPPVGFRITATNHVYGSVEQISGI